MRRDIARTVLVVAEQPFLWGSVRGTVDTELAMVRRVTAGRLQEVWPRLSPWPWLVVGAAPTVPPALAGLVGDLPIPVLWIGRPTGSLPRTLISFEDWSEVAVHLTALAEHEPAGVSLLPSRGVRGVAERSSRAVAALEGLMAAPEAGLPRFRHLADVERLIRDCQLPCRLRVGPDHVRLVRTAPLSRDREQVGSA